ncbi:MAG: T9SS type A sorting domain-containing protein [Ignavibacteriales bacterium]|nr:T9SS type A sorting domain-containing protein [Ignavibacteriales bacterium]
MMKRTLTLIVLSVVAMPYIFAQVHVGAKFIPKKTTTSPDSAYFGDIGVRGSWVAPDLDNDGKPEIFVTDYTKTGRVHAFQAVGNDTLEWIWSSPRLDLEPGLPYGAGGASTPRTIRHGDMDGDGKGEIIFPRGGIGGGILIFEWDGVNGSHKFGMKPSAFIPATVPYGPNFGALAGTANEGGLQLTVEHFEADDVDGDGVQELVLPKNLGGSINDDFLSISAVGTWEFEDQGFASFQIEGSTGRLASSKFGGGSPYAIHPADLDGDGKKELVCHNWNFLDYWVIKVTGTDSYVLPDTANTTNGNQFFQMTPGLDYVALFGGIVANLDKDNNTEVYFPLYSGLDTLMDGALFVVDYNNADNVQLASAAHGVKIADGVSRTSSGAFMSSFTGVVADLDGNGKQEILVGSSYPSNVVGIEYNGSGSLRDPANYTRKVFYTGEKDTYGTINYRDSAGVKDTTKATGEGFVSKMSKPVDIDGDGKIEIILPYQSLVDSVTYNWQHYDNSTGEFVTDSSKKTDNPKKWAFRSLERDVAGSVIGRNLTVITPDDYQLNQNYPNPFNPATTINFVLPLDKKVSAKVYDMLGKEIRTLIANEDYAKGPHNVVWNGKDNNGRQVSSGTYIFRMTAGNVEKSMKMMMLK